MRAVVQHVHGQQHRDERKGHVGEHESRRVRGRDHDAIQQRGYHNEEGALGNELHIGKAMVAVRLQMVVRGTAQIFGQRRGAR